MSPSTTTSADQRAGAIFAALGDGTRRAVLVAVASAGTTTPTELARQLPITRQAVTKHLGVLRDAGLIDAERVGRRIRYSTRPGSLHPAADWLARADASWAGRLDRLKARVER